METQLMRRIQRRLTCPYVKQVSNDIIHKLESGTTITEIFETLMIRIYELVTDQIPLSALIQTHRVGERHQYISDTFYMKLFTDRLRNQGYSIADTVSFLVINNSSPLFGDKLILPEEFDPMHHVLDYNYYIKSFPPEIDRLCLYFFPVVSDLNMLRQIIDDKTIYINEPIRLIRNYYRSCGNLETLLPEVIKEPN
jgi:DNA polymerase elongation subunit (family B)